MPELQELRDALTHLADRVDERRSVTAASDLIAALGADPRPVRRRATRRLTIGGPLVAAAAVAVVAVVAAPALTGHRASPKPAPTSAAASVDPPRPTATPSRYAAGIPRPAAGAPTPLRLDFVSTRLPGFSVAPLEVNRLYESAEVTAEGLRSTHNQDIPPGGEIYVFYRGVFDPASVPHLGAVQVNGRRGWVTRTGGPTETRTATDDAHTDGVVWEYARDSWALVLVDGATYRALGLHTRTQNLALARSLHPGVQPLRIPFRINGRPTGLRAEAATSGVTTSAAGELRAHSAVGLADGRSRAKGQDYQVGSALQVSVDTAIGEALCPPASCRRLRIGGRQVYEHLDHGRPTELSADVGHTTITVDIDPAHLGRYTATQLGDVLARIDVAPDLTNPATWFDAQLSER